MQIKLHGVSCNNWHSTLGNVPCSALCPQKVWSRNLLVTPKRFPVMTGPCVWHVALFVVVVASKKAPSFSHGRFLSLRVMCQYPQLNFPGLIVIASSWLLAWWHTFSSFIYKTEEHGNNAAFKFLSWQKQISQRAVICLSAQSSREKQEVSSEM